MTPPHLGQEWTRSTPGFLFRKTEMMAWIFSMMLLFAIGKNENICLEVIVNAVVR